MDEFSFINEIKQSTYKQASLLKGIGDDAAVFRQPNMDIVTTVDTFVEGIHFSKETMEPYHIGYRLLAANISDMAAMGATPAFYLVSIVIPAKWSNEALKQVYEGMHGLAKKYGIDLIGGDTVSGKELSLSITVIGFVSRDKARYRDAALPGDIVFVTGSLGDSQAGLHLLTSKDHHPNKDYYIRRHRMPAPRVAFARSLEQLPRVALNDISDGIASEAAEIAEASGVSITLEFEKLPKSDTFDQFETDDQRKWQLFGGEDFELIGTVGKTDWPFVVQAAGNTNTRITAIGHCDLNKPKKVYLLENNQLKPLEKLGYNHLSR